MEAFGAFVALVLGAVAVAAFGIGMSARGRELAAFVRSFRALPPAPATHEVADVAVRLGPGPRGGLWQLDALVLVPGQPAHGDALGASLATDEALPEHVRASLRGDLARARLTTDGTRVTMVVRAGDVARA